NSSLMRSPVLRSVCHFLLLSLVLLTGCTIGPRIVRMSSLQGDFVVDTRDPREVCLALRQEKKKAQHCTLREAKASSKERECVDGMSVAGCFTCTFECPWP
ncbi:MAG: hypothetical protein V1876_04105, partial [Candidatus Peregrinibacteria bacterium]